MNTILTELDNYFEAIAVLNIDIKHSPTKKAFYKLSEDESSAIKVNASSPRLEAANYFGRYKGDPEALDKPVSYVLKILVKADATETGKQAAFSKAESIMDDIVAKIAYDSIMTCELNINFQEISFDKIGPEGQNEYGYRLTIPFRNYAPPYNPLKWQ